MDRSAKVKDIPWLMAASGSSSGTGEACATAYDVGAGAMALGELWIILASRLTYSNRSCCDGRRGLDLVEWTLKWRRRLLDTAKRL